MYLPVCELSIFRIHSPVRIKQCRPPQRPLCLPLLHSRCPPPLTKPGASTFPRTRPLPSTGASSPVLQRRHRLYTFEEYFISGPFFWALNSGRARAVAAAGVHKLIPNRDPLQKLFTCIHARLGSVPSAVAARCLRMARARGGARLCSWKRMVCTHGISWVQMVTIKLMCGCIFIYLPSPHVWLWRGFRAKCRCLFFSKKIRKWEMF